MQIFQHYIDGEFSDGSTQFDSLDPATGTPWALSKRSSRGIRSCSYRR